MKLPIFVARQWIRHRTANVNEISARYSVLDREFYVPAPEHLAAQSATNAQGRGEALDGEEAADVLDRLRDGAARAYDDYEAMLSTDGRRGLARELARMALPASVYTQWYWKADLHNLLSFLRLRADPHAQWEIRAYAEAIGRVVAGLGAARLEGASGLPYRWSDALGRRGGLPQRRLAGETVTFETSGMSQREWREFETAWS